MDDLHVVLQSTQFRSAEITTRTRAIYEALLKNSRHIEQGNFTAIHAEDLRSLLAAYDTAFFDGRLEHRLQDTPLRFRLSKRLTSSAGMTTRRTVRKPLRRPRTEYEIAISTTLLFQTFRDEARPISASGVLCRDRVEALQRVFEHELIHLLEMLAWNASNCSAGRFQSIAERFFGHREHTHRLITQRERAATKFGLRVGDRVQFRLDGRHFHGLLNRITRRATVLVEDPTGIRYSNGKHYSKFYVPLDHLSPLS